jgi:hypothetical protein
MFRSTTIIRELILSLAKVILKHSLKYVVIGYVVMWQHVIERSVCCMLCTLHNAQHTRHSKTSCHTTT